MDIMDEAIKTIYKEHGRKLAERVDELEALVREMDSLYWIHQGVIPHAKWREITDRPAVKKILEKKNGVL